MYYSLIFVFYMWPIENTPFEILLNLWICKFPTRKHLLGGIAKKKKNIIWANYGWAFLQWLVKFLLCLVRVPLDFSDFCRFCCSHVEWSLLSFFWRTAEKLHGSSSWWSLYWTKRHPVMYNMRIYQVQFRDIQYSFLES